MSAGINVIITEKPIDYPVELDFSKLTWAHLLEFQQAQGIDEQKAQQMLTALVTLVTGVEASEMPAVVVMPVATAIMARMTGGDEDKAKN